jgi:hypothetical protein
MYKKTIEDELNKSGDTVKVKGIDCFVYKVLIISKSDLFYVSHFPINQKNIKKIPFLSRHFYKRKIVRVLLIEKRYVSKD